MTTANYDEFRIDVTASKIFYAVGPRTGPVVRSMNSITFVPDQVTLCTAQVLEQWLNWWDRITGADTLLDDRTIKVVGTQLWRLLLGNEVGDRLKAEIDQPRPSPLHLLINFDRNAPSSLRGLPWEFLCRDDVASNGFLALSTNLLLTRYVDRAEDRDSIEPTEGKLGVLFVNLLPGQVSHDVHENFKKLRNAVAKLDNVWSPKVVESLEKDIYPSTGEIDPSTGETDPTTGHIDVVHVIGQCNGDPDNPRMYLKTPLLQDWQSPQPLVDALTAARHDEHGKLIRPPNLVVLHLRERDDGDASDNFERVAPMLIHAGIPAVLALQYSLPPAADVRGVGVEFYTQLAKPVPIGQAVQNSRSQLKTTGRGSRGFGTPVLYLQDDGPLRKAPAKAEGSRSTTQLTSITTPAENPMRTVMLNELDELTDDGAYPVDIAHVRSWLEQTHVPDTFPDARDLVNDEYRNTADEDVKDIFQKLIRAMKDYEQGGRGDDRRRRYRAEPGGTSQPWSIKDRRP